MTGLAIIGALVLIPVTSILNGWVLTKLWGWFVVPVFGLPALSIAPAIGLSIIVGYLTIHANKSNDSSSNDGVGLALFKAISTPLLYLFFGWIVSLFM